MERTFVMIKNDAVKRRLIGKIVSKFEEKGLYVAHTRVVIPSMDKLKEHYAEHVNKPFFKGMAESMSTSQVFMMVLEGHNAVKIARSLIGPTNPIEAPAGTIRGDYGMSVGKNVIHGADSVESAEREIKIWFGDNLTEIVHFDKNLLYE